MQDYKELISSSLIGTGTNLTRKVELNLIKCLRTDLQLPKESCSISFRRHLAKDIWIENFSLDYPIHNVEICIHHCNKVINYIAIIDVERIAYEGTKVIQYIKDTLSTSENCAFPLGLGRYIVKLGPDESNKEAALRATNEIL